METQRKRCETGLSQPTIEVIRRIALTLIASADMLPLEDNEQGPDELFKLQFEALSRLDNKERDVAQIEIAGILHLHDAKPWTQAHRVVPVVRAKARAKTRKAGSR